MPDAWGAVPSAPDALIVAAQFPLRPTHWVTRCKTVPDIGDILGTSPRTVNKHLEHIYEKLSVETRTAAANLALTRLRTPGTETNSG